MSSVEIQEDVQAWVDDENYKQGFFTELKTDELDKGINESVVRAISAKRNEPDWMLTFRLEAFKQWKKMTEPHWLKSEYPALDYQNYSYYSAPSCGKCENDSVDGEVSSEDYLTEEVKDTFEKLGVLVEGNDHIAVDAIFDSVSVKTTCPEN